MTLHYDLPPASPAAPEPVALDVVHEVALKVAREDVHEDVHEGVPKVDSVIAKMAVELRVVDGSGEVDAVASARTYERVKRIVDIAGSAAGLIALTPIFLVIGLAIKLEDGGPILHRRRVVGLRGRPVFALKFRTMIPDADAYLARHPALAAVYAENVKLRDDPRVTRVGALLRQSSFDELPQLVNVLRGEMSLVGPRMIHPSEEARYGAFAATRRRVRPGITGLWQVSGRQELSYADRVQLDLQYLRRRCLLLDLQILLRTIPALLLHRGAY